MPLPSPHASLDDPATPPPPPPSMVASVAPPPSPLPPHRLLAAIDMGTNSFKLLLARAHPTTGRILPVDRLKSPVLLGRSLSPDGSLHPDSHLRALAALRSFSLALRPHPAVSLRIVATAAVRNAPNRSHLLSIAHDEMGLDIDVLSGEDEARLIYRGVLQFLPLYEKSILTIDIGGGSTEFVVGHKGEVLFAASLRLGHVCLTELFVEKSNLDDLRRHIRTVLYESNVVSMVRDLGFEVAVGSSGTIRSIERAIFLGCAGGLLGGEFSRGWRFTREELGLLVNKLCGVGLTEVNGVKRLGFSKKRAEYIVAGAILLSEIFDALSITAMEVSGYALGEGVVSEMLERDSVGYDMNVNARCRSVERDSVGYDMNVNARWRSVVGLAVRCDGENRMKSAVRCLSIAKEIFDGVRRSHELGECRGRAATCLDEKDSEYLEAGVLLHNIGLMFGQKGYHKLSYKIIKNGAHLSGYSPEELELVALLARFHRKKYPRYKHTSLLNSQMELKFRALCVIIRVSYALQQSQCPAFQGLEVSFGHEGFRLVMNGLKDHQLTSHDAKLVDVDLQSELEHFEEVFQNKLIISLAKAC